MPAAWNLHPDEKTNYLPTQYIRLAIGAVVIPLLAVLIRFQVRGTPMPRREPT